MTGSAESPLVAALERDGFVIVPSLLSTEQVSALRAAAAHITSIASAGQWPHIRTVGKQFPPWPTTPSEDGIWGVQHLLHPNLPIPPAERQAFLELYFGPELLGVSKELLGCSDDDLVMELCNMLVRPGAPFELRWHRDDIPAEATPEEELERLAEPAWHAQWNLALYDDDSLVVVPGSHRRARTEVERSAAPYEPSLPGMLKVALKAGDAVFYDNNILHRGVYDTQRERMTPHGTFGHAGGDKARARNVLQHGVGAWVDTCDFADLGSDKRVLAEAMRERLVRMGRENTNVGFSLVG
ncbi:hypothetical protein GQ53DRAFT_386070 [Thozetella sp. PMI_491]|nr:hypothetical protein GQ53DRAFT_386070 [Thozetella sp. PMI_491]